MAATGPHRVPARTGHRRVTWISGRARVARLPGPGRDPGNPDNTKMFRERRKAARSDIIPVTSPTLRFTMTTGRENHPGRFRPGRPRYRLPAATATPASIPTGATPFPPNSATAPAVCRTAHLDGINPGRETAIPSKVPPIPGSSSCIFQYAAECTEFEDQRSLTTALERARRARTPPPHRDFAPLFVPRISPQRSSSTCANRGILAPKEGKSW